MDWADADPADEHNHDPGDEHWWGESYYFDFARPDGSLGGYGGGVERKGWLLRHEGVDL